jgi:uncharacterized zinc-type alcohol dehydrogenase-like protein
MTYNSKAYAAPSATERLGPFTLNRREAGPHDVQIEIVYCGVCHSDIHQVRNEWGNSIYPMVPGHEIVGRVTKVGDQVRKFNVGDLAGVGCCVSKNDERRCEVPFRDRYREFEELVEIAPVGIGSRLRPAAPDRGSLCDVCVPQC